MGRLKARIGDVVRIKDKDYISKYKRGQLGTVIGMSRQESYCYRYSTEKPFKYVVRYEIQLHNSGKILRGEPSGHFDVVERRSLPESQIKGWIRIKPKYPNDVAVWYCSKLERVVFIRKNNNKFEVIDADNFDDEFADNEGTFTSKSEAMKRAKVVMKDWYAKWESWQEED